MTIDTKYKFKMIKCNYISEFQYKFELVNNLT